MKLFLIRIISTALVLFTNNIYAKNFDINYNVSTSGIKIGEFSWELEVNKDEYNTTIYLENSGIFSPLYKFEGKYVSSGKINNGVFKSFKYKQYWKTRKKIKVIEMDFDNYLINLYQNPEEKELSRIDLKKLYLYFDPITSFINILSGAEIAKTVDGRRVYVMKRNDSKDQKKITIEIKNYKNIWADHKRNDLKKIEFLVEDEVFLPESINIYFKDRVFKLKKV